MILQSVDEICGAGVTRLEGYMHTPEMAARTDAGKSQAERVVLVFCPGNGTASVLRVLHALRVRLP